MGGMNLFDVLLSIGVGGVFGWVFGQIYIWINKKEE